MERDRYISLLFHQFIKLLIEGVVVEVVVVGVVVVVVVVVIMN